MCCCPRRGLVEEKLYSKMYAARVRKDVENWTKLGLFCLRFCFLLVFRKRKEKNSIVKMYAVSSKQLYTFFKRIQIFFFFKFISSFPSTQCVTHACETFILIWVTVMGRVQILFSLLPCCLSSTTLTSLPCRSTSCMFFF